MENTQPTKTKNEPESKVGTSDASIKSRLVADSENKGSTSSLPSTTAAIPKGSTKTWTSAELAELKLRAGLVAGALADFQAAGGIVVTKGVNNNGILAIKIYLVADGLSVKTEKTPDGLDIVVEPSGIVAENEK